MMFLFTFLLQSAVALTVVIDHPEKGIISQKDIAIEATTNVGVLTMSYLDSETIAYDGSELGFMSIDGLEQRLDILSKSEMKAYGWCFSIDGIIPETLAHQTEITGSEKELRWFYAFAHYQAGVWLSQCEE